MPTAAELFEDKMAVPTLSRKRAATKRYNMEKFDEFKDF